MKHKKSLNKKSNSVKQKQQQKQKQRKQTSKIQKGGAITIENNTLYIFIGFVGLLIVGYVFYNYHQEQKQQQAALQSKIADVDKQLTELNSITSRSSQSIFAGNDLRDPAVPDRRGGVPINVRTRGEPEAYRNVGYLFINNPATTEPAPTAPATEITTETNTINVSTNVNVNTGTNTTTLPLYGRRVYSGADRWNYYVLNDSYNQMRLPLTIDNKDSMDEYGVKELYDNDTVFLPSYGKTFTVKIYETDEYRYIPY